MAVTRPEWLMPEPRSIAHAECYELVGIADGYVIA
jgi:hypothetical protein